MTYPLTVSLTPAFYYEGDWLLRAQLCCLSEQKETNFGVLIIDPHYSKRVGYMGELASKYRLNVTHVPYKPNQNIAKRLDCAVFNAAYCYSESPRIVRYSCWRFVRPDFTRVCLESPTNVDFRFHSIEPTDKSAQHRDCNEETNHNTDIWNFGSDVVNWNRVPDRYNKPGATWGIDSDMDAPKDLFFRNAYGNYCVSRKDWMTINGCNEAQTNVCHYEDMEFCVRARNAGVQCERKAHVLYRLSHNYGNHSGRANIRPDFECKKNCPQCEAACHILEPNRFDWQRRALAGEVELYESQKAWICKTCLLCGPMYSRDPGEHLNAIESRKTTQAPVFKQHKIGRNIRLVAGAMDGKGIEEKVRIYNDSWLNPYFYNI